jgi:hypothetical protein
MVQDGEVSMQLNQSRFLIPLLIWNQSQVLVHALASGCDSSAVKSFTLVAPIEWLEAWVACFVTEKQSLASADSVSLVRCLMVRFFQTVALSS